MNAFHKSKAGVRTMTKEKKGPQESKRKTLKTLLGSAGAVAGASALPEKWSKPLISSVVLPAHGQLSQCEQLDFEADFFIEGGDSVRVFMEASGETVVEADVDIEFEYVGSTTEVTEEFESELDMLLAGQTFETADGVEMAQSGEVAFEYCAQELDFGGEIETSF